MTRVPVTHRCLEKRDSCRVLQCTVFFFFFQWNNVFFFFFFEQVICFSPVVSILANVFFFCVCVVFVCAHVKRKEKRITKTVKQ